MIITLDGGDRATHLSAWYYCALPANNSPDLTALGPWVEIITWNLIRDSLYSTFNANLLGYNDKNTTGLKNYIQNVFHFGHSNWNMKKIIQRISWRRFWVKKKKAYLSV